MHSSHQIGQRPREGARNNEDQRTARDNRHQPQPQKPTIQIVEKGRGSVIRLEDYQADPAGGGTAGRKLYRGGDKPLRTQADVERPPRQTRLPFYLSRQFRLLGWSESAYRRRRPI